MSLKQLPRRGIPRQQKCINTFRAARTLGLTIRWVKALVYGGLLDAWVEGFGSSHERIHVHTSSLRKLKREVRAIR